MEKSELEKNLRKLQELDEQLSENSDLNSEFMSELNKVIENMTQGIKTEQVQEIKDLKFINLSNNPDPTFAEEGDSGFDLRAFLPYNEQHVEAWKGAIIPTGLYFEVEKGLEIQVRPRSGLAAKYWVTVLNTPGTVDSRFRGEVQIIFMNLSNDKFIIKNGDRIAQGVVCPVYGEGRLNLQKVEKLSESGRGTNGFGSSGVK